MGFIATTISPPVAQQQQQPNVSSATAPQSSQARTAARRTLGATEAPIDLRGLSVLPSGNASAAVLAAVPGASRPVNLPTLKNPQGELLDLSELAGFSEGLSECTIFVSF